MSSQVHVLLNQRSGTAGIAAADLAAGLVAAGYQPTIDTHQHLPLEQRVAAAMRSPARLIVAAGGDGTVTALAEAAVAAGKTLAILPLGTANLLARDLGIPLDLAGWLAALPGMAERRIDVGRVNGRLFLHKVVLGFAPAIAAGREKLRGRMDLMAQLALAGFLFRRLLRSRRFAIEFRRSTGEPWIERAQAVAVANNVYDEGLGRIFARARLDDGLLGLYIVRRLGIGDFLRLVMGMLLGDWRHDEALSVTEVHTLIVRIHHRRLKAMVDGEVVSLFSPLLFSVEPGALPVLAPPPAEPAPEPAAAVAEA